MRSIPFGARLRVSFGAVVILLLLPGLVGAMLGRQAVARHDAVLDEQIRESQFVSGLRAGLTLAGSLGIVVVEDGNLRRLPQLEVTMDRLDADFRRVGVLDEASERRVASQARAAWERARSELEQRAGAAGLGPGSEGFADFQGSVEESRGFLNELELQGLAELREDQTTRASQANLQILVLALVGLLGAALSLLIARRLIRTFGDPVGRLREAAEEFGSGNLGHRVHIEGPEEFRDLADAFNEMATNAEQIRAQELHTQRMRVVGQLAAGVAHDFNNLLTAVLTSATLLRDQTEDSQMREDVDTIVEAGERGAQLVEQLLIYARKDVFQAESVDLTALVRQMERLLERTLGERVDLVLDLEAGLPRVQGDPSQLSQVLINLVLNARDAVDGDGRVTIRTASYPSRPVTLPLAESAEDGPHVMLEIRDTGSGIPGDAKDLIFEPFFTTKSRAEGTGLGLSTVQSIVQRCRGQITVSSEPGRGSSFRAFFPVDASTIADDLPRLVPPAEEAPGHRILLVEDDASVLQSVSRMLTSAGHQVLTARSAHEAMQLLNADFGDVDLMLTDIVMPGPSGAELAEQIYLHWPDLPVLYMTGYGTEVLERHGLSRDARVLFKPFSSNDLLAAVAATARPDRIAPRIRDRLRLE